MGKAAQAEAEALAARGATAPVAHAARVAQVVAGVAEAMVASEDSAGMAVQVVMAESVEMAVPSSRNFPQAMIPAISQLRQMLAVEEAAAPLAKAGSAAPPVQEARVARQRAGLAVLGMETKARTEILVTEAAPEIGELLGIRAQTETQGT